MATPTIYIAFLLAETILSCALERIPNQIDTGVVFSMFKYIPRAKIARKRS